MQSIFSCFSEVPIPFYVRHKDRFPTDLEELGIQKAARRLSK